MPKIPFTKSYSLIKKPVFVNRDFNEKVADGAMTKTGKNDGTRPGNSPAGAAPPQKY